MLIISELDLDRLDLSLDDLVTSIVETFVATMRGEIAWTSKAMTSDGAGGYMMSAHALWSQRGIGVFHNLVGAPDEALAQGAPQYRSLQTVFDPRWAAPLAVIDGTATSRLLPVAVTLAAASRLARPASSSLCLIGAGLQARLHFDALRQQFPLERVRILGRTPANAQSLAQHIRDHGIEATVSPDAESAIREADLIVTTVPGSLGLQAFLEPAWVAPGAFVSAVDLARSWRPGFDVFDVLASDDRAQAARQEADGRMARVGRYTAELGEILAGAVGRSHARERIALIHPGNAVGVLAIASVIYRSALAQKIGTRISSR